MRTNVLEEQRLRRFGEPDPESRVDGVGSDDPTVARWRRDWQRGVTAAAEAGDDRLANRRNDYGSYLFTLIDWVLGVVLQVLFAIPLLIGAIAIYAASGHTIVGQGGSSALNGFLQSLAHDPVFNLVGIIAVDGALLLVLWFRLTRVRRGWDIFGLGAQLRQGAGRAILIGIGVGVTAIVAATLVGYLQQVTGLDKVLAHLGGDPEAQQKQLIDPLRTAPPWVVAGTVLAGTFVAPAVEELFFRGYIFRAFAIRKGLPIAYGLSAFTFAFTHLLPTQFLPLFVVGLLLCFAYQRSGSLLGDFTAHAFNNGFAFAVALIEIYHVHLFG